jgi:hypothetical protein
LTVVRIDDVVGARFVIVEMVGFRQVMWIIMLESAMNQIVRVDTPGQYVLPVVSDQQGVKSN